MSERWVINRLFKLQAVLIDWSDEAGRLQYEGPFLETGMEPGALHFRWLLHPALGLPRQPFTLWRARHPGGNPSIQELANLPHWEPIEIVGLPINDAWGDTGYDGSDQGPLGNLVKPEEAAIQRLQRGAPRIGWTGLSHNNLLGAILLPDWEPPQIDSYFRDLMEGRLLDGIRAMLRDRPKSLDHAAYVDREEDVAHNARLNPHLLLKMGVAIGEPNQPARSQWHPLGLLLLSAGTDPLAALALGFGTALNSEPDDLYMVSVRHQIQVGDQMLEFELADVVAIDRALAAPNPPNNLATCAVGHNRPQVMDGPALETIGVQWDRPLNPIFSQLPANSAFPVSYVVGRFGPELWRTEILLTRRPADVGGWLPFTTSKPDEARPVLFADHIVRESSIGLTMFADPDGVECTYGVAAQDIFGRWGHWSTVSFQGENEPPQTPAILAVKLNLEGEVTVDFAWDWADRSPEFVEIIGAFEDDPGNRLFTMRVQFSGNAQPVPDTAVSALNPNRVDTTWGPAQDRNPQEPEVRFYRLHTTIALSFAGKPWRNLQVQARGQCHIHQIRGAAHFDPTFNTSPLSSPVGTRIYDPVPPPPPVVPEAPQWASLRDGAGVSRARLRWGSDSSVAGYVLYEATETTLLAAIGLPGPDTTQPFTDRLAQLRTANLPALRNVFRRVQKELIAPGLSETVYEAALPRGSTVIHFYAVTAVSPNQVESAWPNSSKQFIAVATPWLAIPAAPSLEANHDPNAAAPTVLIGIRLGAGVVVDQIELYRCANAALAKGVDSMGPPLAILQPGEAEVSFADSTIAPTWQRLWYRAVAWSARDDLRGIVEARSIASAPVSVMIAAPAAPEVLAVLVNEPLSTAEEALVSWSSQAPLATTAFGPHLIVVEVRDIVDAPVRLRLEAPLDQLLHVSEPAALPPPDPLHRVIMQVPVGTGYRLYTWLPRVAEQTFHLTLKMIDPLGRIGGTRLAVPPLDPTLRQVTIPAWRTEEEVLQGDEMGINILSAEALGLRVSFEFAQREPGFAHGEVISISPPAGTVINAGSTVTVLVNLEG